MKFDDLVEKVSKDRRTYKIPILYNVNFGHASPRAIIPYGAVAHIDADKQEITLL